MRQTIDVCVLSIKLESGAFTKKKIVVLLGISGGSFFCFGGTVYAKLGWKHPIQIDIFSPYKVVLNSTLADILDFQANWQGPILSPFSFVSFSNNLNEE